MAGFSLERRAGPLRIHRRAGAPATAGSEARHKLTRARAGAFPTGLVPQACRHAIGACETHSVRAARRPTLAAALTQTSRGAQFGAIGAGWGDLARGDLQRFPPAHLLLTGVSDVSPKHRSHHARVLGAGSHTSGLGRAVSWEPRLPNAETAPGLLDLDSERCWEEWNERKPAQGGARA